MNSKLIKQAKTMRETAILAFAEAMRTADIKWTAVVKRRTPRMELAWGEYLEATQCLYKVSQ